MRSFNRLKHMQFAPISIDKYVAKYLAANRGADANDLRRRLREALQAHLTGERCECGQPIWVVGSADAGHACFACITGEPVPDEDYEIDQATGHT